MRVFVTGGSGVLGRAVLPRLAAAGHEARAPSRDELDLFDPAAVAAALAGHDAVLHLATRIPPPERMGEAGAWAENDRLRTDACRLLVDSALAGDIRTFVIPTVTFVYPPGPVDEATPPADASPHLRSALVAEREVRRFAAAGRNGVVLRLGLLYGPGSWSETPDDSLGATLHVDDAGAALVAALDVPSGTYNVVDEGGPVSGERFREASGWESRR